VGDFEAAAINAHLICQHALFCAQSLDEFTRENEGYIRAIQAIHNTTFWAYSKAFQQAALNLMGNGSEPYLLRGEAFDEAEWVDGWKAKKDHSGLTVVTFCKLLLAYLFGRTSEAAELAVLYKQYRQSSAGMALFGRGYLFDSLIQVECASRGSPAERKKAFQEIGRNLKVLRLWARHAPMNHAHHVWLVLAERHQLQGRPAKAVECYANALQLAKDEGFLFDEALISELQGSFFHSQGDLIRAKKQLGGAHYLYTRWGSRAKVSQLERKWDFLLGAG